MKAFLRFSRPRAAALAVGAAFGLSAAPAGAFCRSTTCQEACTLDGLCKASGKPLFWSSSCVGVSLQVDGSNNLDFNVIEQALQGAIAPWSAVQCPGGGEASMLTTRLPDVRCNRTEFDFSGGNANVVIFRDNYWDHEGVDNVLAYTTVSFSKTTGEIRGADIDVNTAFNNFTTTTEPGKVDIDLQSILLHEFGHFLGLAHSEELASVMEANYAPGGTLRELTSDDVDALCAAYPPSRASSCDASPWGGFRSDCSENLALQREQTNAPSTFGTCSAGAPGGRSTPMSPAMLALSASLTLGALGRRRGSFRRIS
jgi:hypothetical protein